MNRLASSRAKVCRRRASIAARQLALWVAVVALGVASLSQAARADTPAPLYDASGLVVRGSLQAGINGVIEHNLFWDYSETFAPPDSYSDDKQWLEAYLKPGLGFSKTLPAALTAYGKISAVGSGTLGKDAYDTGDTGRVTLEEGYLGLRSADSERLSFDVSLGPREFKAGTGMLIANGGSSGFQRGALKLGPHKAWAFAALGQVGFADYSAAAFYLDANESPDSDSGTRITGVDLRYDRDADTFAGATFGYVPESSAPYPQAAPGGIGVPSILPGARNGLKFVNVYGRTLPFQGELKTLFFAADLALERNGAVDLAAWAGRVQLGYTFAEARWSPTLGYAYQTFSGDDPSTSKLERFDPLYYEGNPSAWSTGSKSSMLFINSNINAHQLSLRITPTPRDTLTLRYAHIRANELLSPIQFGQATRVEVSDGVLNPIAGVTDAHLSDDLFLEFNRVVNANTYLTAGVSVAIPGHGSDSITKTRSPLWSGGFVNLVVNY